MDAVMYEQFLAVERSHWWFRARREILLGVVRGLAPAGAPVLDVGCGTGFFLEAISETHPSMGLDSAPVAVSMSRERGLKGVFAGSANDLSAVKGKQFCVVTLQDVIEHLDDDLGALKGVCEVLAPGGHVVVTVPAYPSLWSYHDERNQHRRRYRRRPLEALLSEAGFELVHASYFNCALLPLAWMARTWRRLTGNTPDDEFALPPAPVNELFRMMFQAERPILMRRRKLPWGLSILAVGRKPAEAARA